MKTYEEVHKLTGLYYKRTDGGAEYLCTEHIKLQGGEFVGDITTAVIRLDGSLEILDREKTGKARG